MKLKDAMGRDVIFKRLGWSRDGSNRERRDDPTKLLSIDGLMLVPVGSAVICEGEYENPSYELIKKIFVDDGFPDVEFSISADRWSLIDLKNRNYQSCSEPLKNTFDYINCLNGLESESVYLQKGKFYLKMQEILRLIGAEKEVTAESLKRGCAVNEERPRLLPGDNCKYIKGKKEYTGTIRSIKDSKKVQIQTEAGKKVFADIDNVQYWEDTEKQSEDVNLLDGSLKDNFDFVVQKSKERMMRLPVTKGEFVFPLFPHEDKYGRMENQTRKENTSVCNCPICGWVMSHDPLNHNGFVCCYCRQHAEVLSLTDTDVLLVFMRSPAKNRFAIKETRCCSNCGRFEFETGRQGKRSTGYCKAANQCLQSFNVCNLWYPRAVERYESCMRQHVTNLHYGCSDARNTERQDIKDTIYTEADHKLEVERANEAKRVYAIGYVDFKRKLRCAGEDIKLTEEVTDEIKSHLKEVLDDPC